MAGHTIQVSVLADTKRFSSAMKNLSQQTGLSRLGNAFRSAGRRITGFFRNGIKWAGAFAAAIAGLALKGGFERALKIEDAEAKLRGLGHSASTIDTIMDSALASVKGTAAGMDEAATMAANAVAAGIEPGEDLTRALSLVNDAATIAGVSMDEMGAIFSKVWTSGRAQTQELNQIADRGIPIWTALADHYGVTADELRKMVSRGEVDAATFEQVMTEQLGGAALEAGDTTRGAFANMRAALSRLGEAVLTEIFPMFRESFVGITGWLDTLTDRVKPAAAAFATWLRDVAVPAVRDLWGWLRDNLGPVLRELGQRFTNDVIPAVQEFANWLTSTAVPALRDLWQWVQDNRHVLLAAASAVAGFAAAMQTMSYIRTVTAAVKAATVAFKLFGASLLANPIGLIIAAIAALVAGLVYFFTQTETGRQIWESVWGGIKAVAQTVADWFTGTLLPILQGAWDVIVEGAQIALAWYQEHIAPVFEALGELLAAVWERIVEQAQLLWAGLQVVWDLIVAGWEYLWNGVQVLWAAIGPPIIAAVEGAFNHMKIVLETVWNVIRTVIETVLGVIRGIIQAVTAAIRGDWSGAWEAIKGVAETIWNGIKGVVESLINGVKNVISNVLDTIKSVWSAAWETVKTTLSNAWDSITTTVSNKINEVITFVRELPGRARDALSNIGQTLVNAGRQLIQGFIDGITGAFGSVRDTLGNLTDKLTSWKGPEKRDRTLLKGAGELVIQGFIRGLESQYGQVRRSLTGLTRDVASTSFEPLEAPTVRSTVRSTTGAIAGGTTARAQEPPPIMLTVYLGDEQITDRMRVIADGQILERERQMSAY